MTYLCLFGIPGDSSTVLTSSGDLVGIYHLHTCNVFSDIKTYRIVKANGGYTMSKVSVDIWRGYMTIIDQYGTIIDRYKHEEESPSCVVQDER